MLVVRVRVVMRIDDRPCEEQAERPGKLIAFFARIFNYHSETGDLSRNFFSSYNSSNHRLADYDVKNRPVVTVILLPAEPEIDYRELRQGRRVQVGNMQTDAGVYRAS